ncbi:MAG TPA: hypothetical protein VNB94_10865 [Mycobacteriales bacterium]|nr:hypothetical protein [Mycobacteriales bacterium]
MRSDIHDVEPTRPWDELIATSRRRGTFLRRRRRTLQTLPLVLLLPLALLSRGGSQTSSIDVVDRPDIVEPAPEPTDPAIISSPYIEPPNDSGAITRKATERQAAHRVTGPYDEARTRTPTAPRAGLSPELPPKPAYRTEGFAVEDARGDADGGTGVPAASMGFADIVRTEYKTDPTGLRLSIELAEPLDESVYYMVHVMSVDDGCYLEVFLDGPTASGFFLICGEETEGSFVNVESQTNGLGTHMTIEHALVPGKMRAKSDLTFRALTESSTLYDMDPNFDTVESAKTLRRR